MCPILVLLINISTLGAQIMVLKLDVNYDLGKILILSQ